MNNKLSVDRTTHCSTSQFPGESPSSFHLLLLPFTCPLPPIVPGEKSRARFWAVVLGSIAAAVLMLSSLAAFITWIKKTSTWEWGGQMVNGMERLLVQTGVKGLRGFLERALREVFWKLSSLDLPDMCREIFTDIRKREITEKYCQRQGPG